MLVLQFSSKLNSSIMDPPVTPIKDQDIIQNNIERSISLPSNQKQKESVSIDKFYNARMETSFIHNFAPFTRLNAAGQVESVKIQNNDQAKVEEYQYLIEMVRQREIRNSQLQLQSMQKQARVHRLLGLSQNLKIQNQLIDIALRQSTSVKKRMVRQRQEHLNLSKLLICQGDEYLTIHATEAIRIEGQQIQIEHRIKEVEENTGLIDDKYMKMKDQQAQLDRTINQQQNVSNKKLSQISCLTQQIMKTQKQVSISGVQISVLRMQVSPKLRVGFSTVSLDPQNDRRHIIERDKHSPLWPKNKVKNLSMAEIKDYLIMQLYPDWKKMLNRMSSDFKGYHQILCYPFQEEHRMADLSLYFPSVHTSKTSGKAKSYFIFYSPFAPRKEQILQTVIDLQKIDNGLLRIFDVGIEDMQNGHKDIQIQYEFQGLSKIKRIELIMLEEISREIMLKLLPHKEDKVILMKIQVPVVCSSMAQRNKFEEVYDMVRRWK